MCPLIGDGCWRLFHKPLFDEVLRIRITLMRIRILPFILMRIPILLITDANPDPTFHFDADPDPAPSFQKKLNLEKVLE
jgi:hypothetical protein